LSINSLLNVSLVCSKKYLRGLETGRLRLVMRATTGVKSGKEQSLGLWLNTHAIEI